MKLHENTGLFRDAVVITARQMGIPEIYVEKDYWVTLALRCVFEGPAAAYTVFKGGTALSKCFTYINRFSEDVDLVLVKEEGLSANQLKERLKRISNAVSQALPETEIAGITNKKGMIRKTAHSYPQIFSRDFGQVRDIIILESSWLGTSEPVVKGTVSSYIYQMMMNSGQSAMAEDYQLQPFEVSILAPERTLCEKIMSLVRFSHSENPARDLRSKIRHVYDLHQMLGQQEISQFFDSPEFDKMLHKVGRDDESNFRNNKEWLYIHPTQAMIFSDLDRLWPELSETYIGTFRRLVFGTLPDATLVKKTLERLKERISRLNWELSDSKN